MYLVSQSVTQNIYVRHYNYRNSNCHIEFLSMPGHKKSSKVVRRARIEGHGFKLPLERFCCMHLVSVDEKFIPYFFGITSKYLFQV